MGRRKNAVGLTGICLGDNGGCDDWNVSEIWQDKQEFE